MKLAKIVEVEVNAVYTENGWVTSVVTYLHGNIFNLPLQTRGRFVNTTEKRRAYLVFMPEEEEGEKLKDSPSTIPDFVTKDQPA